MNKKAKMDSAVVRTNGLKRTDFDKYSWDNLSEFQKQQINAGLGVIKHGRVMSSEEFWDQLKNG